MNWDRRILNFELTIEFLYLSIGYPEDDKPNLRML